MAENAKKPAIRFGEFIDAWEERNLGELLSEAKRPIKMLDNEKYNLVTVKRRNGGIVSRGIFNGKNILVKNYFLINAGDFLISKRQVVHGANGIVPKNLDKAVVSNEYLVLMENENISTEFLALLSTRPEMYKLFFLSSYGVDIEKLVFDVEDWKKRRLFIPQKNEQHQIDVFLSLLDRLIVFHQHECNKTTNIKKAMLEKMFPKAGEDKPDIRFAGFTDAWEQEKLSELADFSKGYGYSKGDLKQSGTPIILYGRLYTKYETVISDVDTFVAANENSFFSKGYEVIVPASGETAEDIARASVVEYDGVILGGDLNIIYPKSVIESAFLAITISNGWQQKELAKRAQGKSVVHIHNSDLQEVMLVYPKLEEQNAISSFFRSLDRLLTLHKRELVNLQNMKRALLEKMFV